MEKFLILSLISVLLYSKSTAQLLIPDTIVNEKAYDNAVRAYMDALKENIALYNGSLYPGYNRSLKGSPFFIYDKPIKGTLTYDDIPYTDIPIMYDVLKDELITEKQTSNIKINLVKEKISDFSIAGHSFVLLQKDTSQYSLKETGFYEVLYNGSVILYAKRKKHLQQTQSEGTVISEVKDKNLYFIKKNSQYFKVKNTSSLISIFKDQKKEIKNCIKTVSQKSGLDREGMLIEVLGMYDKLK